MGDGVIDGRGGETILGQKLTWWNLADAARQIGLTEESARTYSKRIFAKTGTSRQPALVSLLLRSIATLA